MNIFDNERFADFRAELAGRGVMLQNLWSAKSDRTQNDYGENADVGCFSVVNPHSGGYTGTIIVTSFGDDGFDINWQSGSLNMDDDIAKIMGLELAS